MSKNGQTSHEKTYAGGDITNGPDLVVTAILVGRTTANGIMKNLFVRQQVINHLKKAPIIPYSHPQLDYVE